MTDEQTNQLRLLAARLHVNEQEALDFVLSEFAPSTQEERLASSLRMMQDRRVFLADLPDDPFAQEIARKAWTHGYRRGWILYQLRHDRTRAVYETKALVREDAQPPESVNG